MCFDEKSGITFLLKFGNSLAKPYLFIGGLPKKNPNTLMGRFRLQIAVTIFRQEYGRTQRNGALFLTGKCFQSLKNHEEALKYFKKVWDTDPFNSILFKEISATCLELGNFEEGLQYALKEVSQFPNNPESKANLAFFLYKNCRLHEAKKIAFEAYSMAGTNDFVIKIYNLLKDAESEKASGIRSC